MLHIEYAIHIRKSCEIDTIVVGITTDTVKDVITYPIYVYV